MTRKTIATLAVASCLGLAACETPGVSDPNDPRARTKDSALAGAAIGALFGKVAGDSEGDVIRSAIVGAGVGAAIGYNLDKQAAELRRDMGGNVDVINTGDELIVTMPQDILFAFDSDSLRPDLRRDLRVLAGSLNDYPSSIVDVVGHTDNVGSDGYNNDLSRRRAQAVASVLVSEGVSSRRLRVSGAGRFEPVASNASESGRAQNRRVEIIIRPANI